jgi:hypothetical protein
MFGCRIFSISLALALVRLSVTFAQPASFEGIVVYKMGAMGGDSEVTQYYKGNKSRTDINAQGQAAVMLMDLSSGLMTMLMPAQKTYMVVDFKKMSEALKGFKPPSGGRGATRDPADEIKATGRTEVIAGHQCEWYTMGSKGEGQVCSAKGLGFFMMGRSPMGGGPLDALGATDETMKMFKDGFFPLKVVQMQGGTEQVVMEATKIERKAVDSTLFETPADYTEMRMPGFGAAPR